MMSESSRSDRAADFNQKVEAEFGKTQASWEKNPETGEAIKSDRYFRVFPEELAERLNETIFARVLKERVVPALASQETARIKKELADLGSNLFGQYFLFDREAANLLQNPFLVSNAANKVYRSQNEICSKAGSFEVEAEGFLDKFLDFASSQKALSVETIDLLRKEGTEIVKGKKLRMSLNGLSEEELNKAKDDIRSNARAYLGNSDWQASDKDEYGGNGRLTRAGYLTRGADELIMQVRRQAFSGVDPSWVRDAEHPNRMTGVNVTTLSGKYSKLAKIEII